MSVEDRVLKLEGFAADVREMTRVLTELIRRHDDRLDEQERAADNLTAKMEALVDAQIRTEDMLQRLTEKVDRLASA